VVWDGMASKHSHTKMAGSDGCSSSEDAPEPQNDG